MIKELVRELGGIRPHKNGHEHEEYMATPLCYRRRNGLPIDEILDAATRRRIMPEGATTSDVIDMIAKPKPRANRRTAGREFEDLYDLVKWLDCAPSIWYMDRPVPCEFVKNWSLLYIIGRLYRGQLLAVKEHEHLVEPEEIPW